MQFCCTRSEFQRNYSRPCVVCFRFLLYFCWQAIASVTLQQNCIILAVAEVHLRRAHISHVRMQQNCSRISKRNLQQALYSIITSDLRHELKCNRRAHVGTARARSAELQKNCKGRLAGGILQQNCVRLSAAKVHS